MIARSISASLVVYQPDLQVLTRTVEALFKAVGYANAKYECNLALTIVDNSNETEWFAQIEDWVKSTHCPPHCQLRALRSPGNFGYAHGNNLVIASAISDYHLVINPDLFVDEDAILEALDFMEANVDVGLLTPSVRGVDGERHYLCKRNPTLFVMFLRSFAPIWMRKIFHSELDHFEMRNLDYDNVIEPIQYPTGCFMFFRTEMLRRIQGFDERFFMYFEDADVGRRMLEIARVVYAPTVKVVHCWARGTHSDWKLRWVTIRSAWAYLRKW
jgi:hypothetical protein